MSTVAEVKTYVSLCRILWGWTTKEPLYLTKEQWGIVALPQHKAESRAGSIADKLVKSAKRKAAQEQLDNVRFAEEDQSNTLHFKYLGFAQWRDADPLAPMNHKSMDQLSEHKRGADWYQATDKPTPPTFRGNPLLNASPRLRLVKANR